MIEKPAGGIRGFLLYSPITNRYFFRIYDPVDKRIFTDYKVCAEDIEIEILAENMLSLYEYDDEEKNKLDWNSRVLGKSKKA